MGVMKKLMKSLSLKEASSKKSGKIRSSRDYESEYLNSSNLAAATTAGNGSLQAPAGVESQPSYSSSPGPRSTRSDIRLDHTRPSSKALTRVSFRGHDEENEAANIQEIGQFSARRSQSRDAHTPVQPQLEQQFTPRAQEDPVIHRQASVLSTGEQNPGTVALTIILDASLSASQHIRSVALGILNLLRLLSADDTISIFGCDGSSSGLFTFPAEAANYPQILDLILNMHKKFVGRQPKLNEAIVMVVEELNGLDESCLKPLIVMSDYQDKEDMGAPFEAQHALLWSTAQNLHPVFVSVWDQDLFSEVKTRTSKEVHMETMSETEIKAAILVVQSQLKSMMKQHKERTALRKSQQQLSLDNEARASSSASIREKTSKESDALVSIPTLPQSLPPIDEYSIDHDAPAEQGKHAVQQSGWEDRNESAPSIASEVGPTESNVDSIANYASSGGNGDRDALSMAEFPNVAVNEKYAAEPDWEAPKKDTKVPQEFEGFPSTSNALFLDTAESDDGYNEYSLADVIKSKILDHDSPRLKANRWSA